MDIVNKSVQDELDTAGVNISYRVTEEKYIVWGVYTFAKFEKRADAVEYALDRAGDILATSDYWMEE